MIIKKQEIVEHSDLNDPNGEWGEAYLAEVTASVAEYARLKEIHPSAFATVNQGVNPETGGWDAAFDTFNLTLTANSEEELGRLLRVITDRVLHDR